MSVVLTQGIQPLEWLVSTDGTYSIDQVTVTVSGATALKSGQVLGQITATGKWVAHSAAATDGSEVAKAILQADTSDVNGDHQAVAYTRHAEVWGAMLNSGVAPTTAAITSLAAAGIIVR
jgi:hypothetical protein